MGARNYLPFRNIWLFVFSCEYGLWLPFGIFKLFLKIFKRWSLLIPYVLYLRLLKEWNKYLQAVNVVTVILVSSNCLAQSHDCKSLERDKYASSYWSWNEIVWGFFLLCFSFLSFLFCFALFCIVFCFFVFFLVFFFACLFVLCLLILFFYFFSYCFCFCSIICFVCPILVQNLDCVNVNHS